MAKRNISGKKRIEWGEASVTSDTIPVIEIQMWDENDEHLGSYYLSAFRGYSFQVSGDYEGHGDCGSTQVFGLGHIGALSEPEGVPHWPFRSNIEMEEIERLIIASLAESAVIKFWQRHAEGYILPRFDIDNLFADEDWTKFITDVQHFVHSARSGELRGL